MRGFGSLLAVLGVFLGIMIWLPGWLLAIVGLLMMIAAPSETKTEPQTSSSRQSTGGFAGLKKKQPDSEFDLGKGPGYKQVKPKHLGDVKGKRTDDPYAGGKDAPS